MITLKTTGQDTHFREVVVKKLGETPRSTKVEEQIDVPKVVLARLSSPYPMKTVPPGVLFLTAFVDVQVDRFEVVVIGWNLQRESWLRSEEHTSELQSIMRNSYAVFRLT